MKIQYYASDLSYALDLGEIADMHVVTLDNGVQVLRIDCLEKSKDEYQTIKKGQKPKTTKPAVKKSTGKKEPTSKTNPDDLGHKLMDIGKKFMSNKEKPNFMKDAGF